MCNGEYLTLHQDRQLFQQYIINMWASTDQTQLAFLHFNQGHLHATLYSGLQDWLSADEIENP